MHGFGAVAQFLVDFFARFLVLLQGFFVESFTSEHVSHQQRPAEQRLVSGTESLIPLKLADNHNPVVVVVVVVL